MQRVFVHAASYNLGLLLPSSDRHPYAPEPAGAGSFGALRAAHAPDRALGAPDVRLWAFKWSLARPASARPFATKGRLKSGDLRGDLHHGLPISPSKGRSHE